MGYEVNRANYLSLGLLTFSVSWSGLKSYFSHMIDIDSLSTSEIIQIDWNPFIKVLKMALDYPGLEHFDHEDTIERIQGNYRLNIITIGVIE